VLFMVFLGAIRTGIRFSDASRETPLGMELLVMVALVLLVHLTMFATGYGLARLARMRREDRIAVAFSGSQKTLMVGLQVAMDAQVSILPMVTYHVGQLIVDTLLADRLRASKAADHKDP
jgi:sodium/bile acid cotransporter 7